MEQNEQHEDERNAEEEDRQKQQGVPKEHVDGDRQAANTESPGIP